MNTGITTSADKNGLRLSVLLIYISACGAFFRAVRGVCFRYLYAVKFFKTLQLLLYDVFAKVRDKAVHSPGEIGTAEIQPLDYKLSRAVHLDYPVQHAVDLVF